MPTLYSLETYGELHPAVEREWLLTNGIGGFACGTAAGANTRRYHGLLVSATLPPVGRVVALSRIHDVIEVAGRRYDLSCGYFARDVIGDGHLLLRRFRIEQESAVWEYEVDGLSITREVLLCWQSNTVGVRYRLVGRERPRGPSGEAGDTSATLRLRPFVALRDFHSLLERSGSEFDVNHEPGGLRIAARGHALHVVADAGEFVADADWWHAHTYPMETSRGLEDTEDLFTPGSYVVDLGGGGDAITLWASTEGPVSHDWEEKRQERISGLAIPDGRPEVQTKLLRAAADFVVRRSRAAGTRDSAGAALGFTVIAGYPWFSDWGRDTFIALPGLLLATGRHEQARDVLTTFAHYVSEGMIPNRFDDYTSQPTYNTVDASLWFIHAAFRYLEATGDSDTFRRDLEPACRAIVAGYTRGTRFGIRVDPADGLVGAGDPTTQLTWMDAKYGDTVFTPRHGKAVEINALWYNALRLLGEQSEAERVRESFIASFWLEGRGLADVVNEHGRDESVRPNQIFAVSLPHSPLNARQRRTVVDVVRRELLTPYGLRTLARGEAGYRPRFAGSMFERDRAYHNGTVWPWLIGPFLDAYLKVHDHREPARSQARVWLRPLLDHLEWDGCIGSISEVFDAEHPYTAGGCFAQAWSVAEVLRVAVELEERDEETKRRRDGVRGGR